MTRSRIFFFDVSGRRLMPLLPELLDRELAVQVADPALVSEAARAGYSISSWDEAVRTSTLQEIRAGVEQVYAQVNAAIKSGRADLVFPEQDGRSFLKTRGAGFVADLSRLLASQIEVIETFAALCESARPDLVVLGGDNSHRQRILIACCRKEGIPTLNLAHATFALTLQARYPANQTHLYADHVAAFGLKAKRDMIALGYPEEAISCPGADPWDDLYQYRGRFDPAAARRHFRKDEDPRPSLLFLTNYAETTSSFYSFITQRGRALHEALARSLATLGDSVRVVFRPHPMDVHREQLAPEVFESRQRLYEAWLAKIGFRDFRISFGDAVEEFLCADIVIGTNGSSTLPMAKILERPVVAYRWYEGESKTFDEAHGVYLADRDCDLGFMIEELLRSPNLRARQQARAERALEEINRGHDGRARERLADLIEQMARATMTSPSDLSSRQEGLLLR